MKRILIRAMSQVRLYYPEDGLGSTVSRIMKKEYFTKFIERHGIKTVLEAPLEDLYRPNTGVASMIFALKGCRVILLQSSEEILNRAKHLWMRHARTLLSRVGFIKSDLKYLPFDSDSFDLVWSSIFAKLEDPYQYMKEAARVSRRFVYIIAPNKWNYGYPIHKIHQFITKQKSEFGFERWMRREAIKDAMRNAGLNIVEEGVHDVPPWPGFVRLFLTAKKSPKLIATRKASDAEVAKSAKKLMFIERSSLPVTIKLLFAHSVYVLGEKKYLKGKAEE